jgi:uncharacterized membrane protein YgaE (UPF0421/DUF939 family)
MATEQDLFVSISPQTYRRGKSLILTSQADLLQSLKHLNSLRVLSRQKSDLKKQLHALASSTLTQINSIQTKIPAPQIPKSAYKNNHKTNLTPSPKEDKTFSKRNSIEEELRLIQAKLKELNS